MLVNCIPIRQLYNDYISGYRILACTCKGKPPDDLQLNDYGNFTISGSNLSSLSIGQEIKLDIREDLKNKRQGSYRLVGLGGIKAEGEEIKVDPDQEYNILCGLMSEGQAHNVNSAYPNFIYLVLNGRESEINYKDIFNVGPVYLEQYIDKVKAACRSILFMPVAMDNGIEDTETIEKLTQVYLTPEELKEAFDTNPYHIYIDLVHYPFKRSDKLVLDKHPEFIDSLERCEYGCMEILRQNEAEGDTRINANLLAHLAKELVPEAMNHIVEAVKGCDLMYYDETTKFSSFKETYEAEKTIADCIKERLSPDFNKKSSYSVLDGIELEGYSKQMDWRDFQEVDGFKMTDEQTEILKLANDQNVMILTGGAGCVDCDTEFFNGKQWKRIADYQDGDFVLQYNNDGTAQLVTPLNYIKQPCDTLWHFETKYGINQTVCDEHNIIYWSAKNYKHTCHIQDIITKQQSNGWNGYFETAFKYNGNGINLTDIEIKLMCAIICDGSFYSKLPNNLTCRFHIKKDRKKQMLRSIFEEYGKPYREVQSANEGYTDFYIEAPRREKYFTSEWYNCSQHQLQIICDNIMFWDGSENYTANGKRRLRFSANVKETADFVQFAFSACGYRATITTRDRTGQQYWTNGKYYTRKSIEYNVLVTTRHKVGICSDNRINHKKTMPQQVPTKDGYKYCFTVPSSMLVLRRKDCIFITGNCGKTSSVRALIRMLEANNRTYTLLAPTGIASKKLKESTSRSACTIHMFLNRNDTPGEYVIIDEMSICSVPLLAKLFNKIEPSKPKIIFVCDEAQLASIDCGNIVQDILDSGVVPRANLTKVFRYNSSGLATIATDARFGTFANAMKPYPDFRFIEISEDPVGQILEQYDKYLEQGYTKEDILILSPFNKGPVGTYVINKAIQSRYNPHPDTSATYKRKAKGEEVTITFKIGDKVLNTHNNYIMPSVEYDDEGNMVDSLSTIPVMNGDIGYIRACKDTETGPELIVEFDSGLAKIQGSDIGELILGYAVSIHKIQGAQAKAVILVIDKSHKSMVTRNLFYVGASRAQKDMTIIADAEAIESGLEKQENKERETWLKDMLIGDEKE